MFCCTLREDLLVEVSKLARGPLRLLARGVDRDLGAAARRGASPGPADGSHLPAPSSSAEALIAAIGLEPRNAHSGRHLKLLQDLFRSRIDSPANRSRHLPRCRATALVRSR